MLNSASRLVRTEKLLWIKVLKLRWQLAARLGLHVPLMHLKREASQRKPFYWSLATTYKAMAAARLPWSKAVWKHRH
jgi:hypothetical protein